ncbi:MAG: phage holin family protein [Betaproteobacteria bacterium]|nr:phage holin family protein [Betaproteobacteria bacterium]
MTADPENRAGTGGVLRGLLAQGVAILATRSELAALELADARDRALRWVVLGLVASVLLLAALTTLSLWVAVLFWDGPRAWAVGALAATYLVAGGVLLAVIRRQMSRAPALLSQTRDELRKDRESLGVCLSGGDDGAGRT